MHQHRYFILQYSDSLSDDTIILYVLHGKDRFFEISKNSADTDLKSNFIGLSKY